MLSNVLSCGLAFSWIQTAQGLLLTTCNASERLRILHALHEQCSSDITDCDGRDEVQSLLCPFQLGQPRYPPHYCNLIHRVWPDEGNSPNLPGVILHAQCLQSLVRSMTVIEAEIQELPEQF